MERHIQYMMRRLKEENYKGHTLHAFGASITYGYDLSDCDINGKPTYSSLTYSALFAKFYNMNYKCHAIGGSSNNGILRQIKLANIKKEDTCFIMWTFAIKHAFMFDGEAGFTTLNMDDPNHAWWWKEIDQSSEICLERTTESILAAQAILDSIKCKYVFLCDNIELQNAMQNSSKWIDKNKWLFLPPNHNMINTRGRHPFDDVHYDVFNLLKEIK